MLIEPSAVIARGLESVFAGQGEFEVCGILSDLSHSSEARIRNMAPDVMIVDPVVFDYSTRAAAKSYLSELSSAMTVGLRTTLLDDGSFKQYDEVIGLYEEPAAIVRKLRGAVESRQDAPRSEGEELSSREKEILVCVAKGMLNKEIADAYNISIYTVITHRKNITRKTGIKTVAGLTVYALLNNLIDINSFE